MNLHLKPLLLSAFVLPGLGQLYKGDRVKGVILILIVNLFLLGGLFVLLQALGPAIVTARISGAAEAAKLINKLPEKAAAAQWLLAGLFGLWLYAAVDAALRPAAKQTNEQCRPDGPENL